MKVISGQDCYEIRFTNNIDEVNAGLKKWFDGRPSCKKVLLVIDGNLAIIQEAEMCGMSSFLSSIGLDVSVKIIESGESSKSLEKAEMIWSHLAELQFTRKDVLIALGGGVIGDLSGFCASAYMRGIEFIQIPTTLLSQIDSSIGGKVAVNLSQGKNLVGAFYNPAMVIMHNQFLKTLKDEVLSDGVGELVKYAFLGHNEILSTLEYYDNLEGFRNAISENHLLIGEMMALSLRIKKVLVENDFKESGLRRYLNLGHTLGHAIEKGEAYRYSHGHCVANGCLWALKLADHEASYEQLRKLMSAYRIPILEDLKISDLMGYLKRDKKSEDGGVHFIIPNPSTPVIIDRGERALEEEDGLGTILDAYENHKNMSDALFLEGIQMSAKVQWIPFDTLEGLLLSLSNKTNKRKV